MHGMQRWSVLVLASVLACATASTQGLDAAVQLYNDGLRWKRLTQAAQFRADRAQFLARYLAAEDKLNIESLEVRAVSPVAGRELPTFDVTVVAEAYVLPSTVLARRVLTERWQEREGAWELVSCEPELAP